ncbi:hypothetical protein VPH35_078523 [Triticum aestivum]
MRGDDELLRTWGAARPEIQSAHAHQGRSCSAPVPKLPPGSLPPPSSGTEARFSGGGGNLQAESDPSSSRGSICPAASFPSIKEIFFPLLDVFPSFQLYDF